MVCQDLLRLASWADLATLAGDPEVREHCNGCQSCSTVLSGITRERQHVAQLMSRWDTDLVPAVVARRAIATAALQRRRDWLRRSMQFSFAGVALLIALMLLVPPAKASRMVRRALAAPPRTIALRCLHPTQAAELVAPYLTSRGSGVVLPPQGVLAITLRGTRGEISRAATEIDRFDNSRVVGSDPACDKPVTSPLDPRPPQRVPRTDQRR